MLSKKQKAYLQTVAMGLIKFIETEGAEVPAAVKEFQKKEPTEIDDFFKLAKNSREFLIEARQLFGTQKVIFTDNKVKDLAWKHHITHLGQFLVKNKDRKLWEVQLEERNGRQFVVSFNFTKI